MVVRPAVDSHDGMLGVVEGSNKWPVASEYIRSPHKEEYAHDQRDHHDRNERERPS